MKENEVIIGGYYRHYKGKEYVVLAVGRNSENPFTSQSGSGRKKCFWKKSLLAAGKLPALNC